jgi:YkoY family integral membrane protein
VSTLRRDFRRELKAYCEFDVLAQVAVFNPTDLFTVLLLVVLEGLLSADNAMVLAVLVLGLPKPQQRKALRYGIVGAFAFRSLAVVLAIHLIELNIVKLLGGAYLLWLPYRHFFGGADPHERRSAPKATPWLGLSAFWATVVRIELTDIVFAIDSILVAVAMSPKLWVILTGGLLGIVMMRMVIGRLLSIIERYPPLVDGAFVIITWVGLKLLAEYLHAQHYIDWEVPQWLSLTLIVVIFTSAFLYARTVERRTVSASEAAAEALLTEDDQT